MDDSGSDFSDEDVIYRLAFFSSLLALFSLLIGLFLLRFDVVCRTGTNRFLQAQNESKFISFLGVTVVPYFLCMCCISFQNGVLVFCPGRFVYEQMWSRHRWPIRP